MPPCGAGTRVGSRPGSRHTSLAARPRAHRAGLPGSGTARGGPLLPPPGTRTPCRYHRPVPSRPVPLRPHLPRRPNRHHPGASPPPPPSPGPGRAASGEQGTAGPGPLTMLPTLGRRCPVPGVSAPPPARSVCPPRGGKLAEFSVGEAHHAAGVTAGPAYGSHLPGE